MVKIATLYSFFRIKQNYETKKTLLLKNSVANFDLSHNSFFEQIHREMKDRDDIP